MKNARRLATFKCGVCGIWTQGGDFLSVGHANQFGEREHYNFVCFGCQHNQRRSLPARARARAVSEIHIENINKLDGDMLTGFPDLSHGLAIG